MTLTKVPVNALARSEAIMVATFATSATVGNRRSRVPLPASARNSSSVTDLGVEAVLDGTVQRDGNAVRVTAYLISLKDGKTVWSEKFDEDYTNTFALQDSIAEVIAWALPPEIGSLNKDLLASHPTKNPDDTKPI